jgi:hypothetical protein
VVQIRLVLYLREFGDQGEFGGNLTAHLRACFGTFPQYAWHKPLALQSNQVREVDTCSKLHVALISQVTLFGVIGEITLILLFQCAVSKGI